MRLAPTAAAVDESAEAALAAEAVDAAATDSHRYWAFISYNHADERHARWLHRELEGYRLPKRLVGTRSETDGLIRPARLRPVYRDRDEAVAGSNLGSHLKQALESSRHLIVLCSPNVKRSRYVDQEVRHFRSLGREQRIYCLIVDGPADAPVAQLMPDSLGLEADGAEPLAADARPGKDGRRLATLRLIAAMVDTRFDELRQRDQEQRVRRLTLTVAVTLVLLAVVALLALDAFRQRGVAQQQAANAKEQEQQAIKARDEAVAARTEAEERKREAVAAGELARQRELGEKAAKELARQRQGQAEVAQQRALRALEDATLRRLAAECQTMFSGARAGGSVMALRLVMAAHAVQPRTDLLAAMQPMVFEDASLRAWDVPGNSISASALSPDRTVIATATSAARDDFRIRLWRTDTGEPLGEIRSDIYMTGLAIAARGNLLVATDTEGGVHRYNLRTRERIGVPLAHDKAWIRCVAVSPDGRQWITGAAPPRTLVLWTDRGGMVTRQDLAGQSDEVSSAAFSADGLRIATGSNDGTVRLWNAQTGVPVGEAIRGHTEWVTSVAFSPDGSSVASGGHDRTVRVWRLGLAAPTELRIDDAGGGIGSVAWSPDGRLLVTSGHDGMVRVWDALTGKPVGSALAGHRGAVEDVGFMADGKRLVSAGVDGTLRLWHATGAGHTSPRVVQHGELVTGLALARDAGSRRAAATDLDGTLRQWDASTGQAVGAFIRVPRNTLNAVAYGADTSRLITASSDGAIRIWNAETGRAAMPPLRGHDKPANALAVSSDGKTIVSSDRGGRLIVWDAAAGQPLHRIELAPNLVLSVAVSADGRRFAASGTQGLFALWDTATGGLIHRAAADPFAAYPALTFSADGRIIALADRRQSTLALRSGVTGQPVARTFAGHGSGVEGVTISPDGKFIASVDASGLVRLWITDTGEPLGAPLSPGLGSFMAVAMGFTVDGQKLVAAGARGQATVWDAPAAWPRLLCERLTRNFTAAEWDAYVGKGLKYTAGCAQYPQEYRPAAPASPRSGASRAPARVTARF